MSIIETQYFYGRFPSRWNVRRFDLSKGADCARYIARERFAWPGGYALFAVCSDGGALCADCCRAEYPLIARASRDPHDHSGWRVVGMDTAECCEETMTCDHCGAVIFDANA